MTREVAEDIGNRLGCFMELDQAQSWGASIRIRVSLDVRVPLRKCLRIRSAGRELTATYTYERLPNFCYICGILGHIMQDCPASVGVEATEEGENLQYSAWLRESRTVCVNFSSSYRGSEGGLWGSYQGQRGRKGASIFDFRGQVSATMGQQPESDGGLTTPVVPARDAGGPSTSARQLNSQGNVGSGGCKFGSENLIEGNVGETMARETEGGSKQVDRERTHNIPSPYHELSSIQAPSPVTKKTQQIGPLEAQPHILPPISSPNPISPNPTSPIPYSPNPSSPDKTPAQITSSPEVEITLLPQITSSNVIHQTPSLLQQQTEGTSENIINQIPKLDTLCQTHLNPTPNLSDSNISSPTSNSSWNGIFGSGGLISVPIAFMAGVRGGRRGRGRRRKETERLRPRESVKRKEGFSGGESSKKKLMLNSGEAVSGHIVDESELVVSVPTAAVEQPRRAL